jgi:predicted heme/steroid binding protein
MKNYQVVIVLISVILGLGIIIGTIAYKNNSDVPNTYVAEEAVSRTITTQELATYDGINGRECYIVLNGVVYEISQGNKWKEGQHIPSEGLAYCGQDLTEEIDKSPHGKSILSLLKEAGKLQQ